MQLTLVLTLAVGLPSVDAAADDPPSAERGIVLLVSFPDTTPRVEKSFLEQKFSVLERYVREMSYGKRNLSIEFTDRWYPMPHPVSRYKISSRNLEVDKSRVKAMMDDALDVAAKDVDFSKYTFVAVVHAATVQEYGMVGLCAYPGMLGWQSEQVSKSLRGHRINKGVAIFSCQAPVGTLFHDIAHILGGVKDGKRLVPCLYDHDLQAKPGPPRETAVASFINMGFWDPMSCHWYKLGVPPPGVSSWTKLRFNWIDPAKVRVVRPRETTEILLGPLESDGSDTLVIRIPVSESTYYLMENRQPIGTDRYLPGSGVLIMYADDRIGECRHGAAPVKLVDANPEIPNLEGAAFDVGKKDSFVDEKSGITVRLIEKVQWAYRVRVQRTK